MAPKAGLEIHADLKSLRKELTEALTEFRKFNSGVISAATGLGKVEEAAKKTSKVVDFFHTTFGRLTAGLTAANIASNAITRVLGSLKTAFVNLVRGSIQASSALQELDSKARILFGESFPEVRRQAELIAKEVGRASSSILQFSADIAAVIEASGIGGQAMADMSTQLAKLAVDLASFHNTADEEAFDALRSGLTGIIQPMKRFGIVMTEANLAEFALTNGVRQNINSMNQAQMTALRFAYIMDKTKTSQGDAARTADSYANQVRRLQGEWKTLEETLGREVTPVLAKALAGINASLEANRGSVEKFAHVLSVTLIAAFDVVVEHAPKIVKALGWIASAALKGMALLTPFGGMGGVFGAMFKGVRDIESITSQFRTGGVFTGKLGSESRSGEESLEEMIRKLGGAGGGGGKGAGEDLAKAEKEMLQAMGEQARLHLERLQKEREELKLKQEMGVLTDEEKRRLETINRRMAFQADLIQEATEAWREQRQEIERTEDRIKDLNVRIAEEREQLQRNILQIEGDAQKSKVELAADLVREMREIETEITKGAVGERLLELEQRKQEIDKQLDPFRLTKEGQGILSQADTLAGITDPFQMIDVKKEERLKEAQEKSEERTKELQADLDAEEKKLAKLRETEAEKKAVVIAALQDRAGATLANYQLIEEATEAHIKVQIEQFNRLSAAIAASTAASNAALAGASRKRLSTAPRFATGGQVFGEGGTDKVLDWLTAGEHVMNVAAARAYQPILELMNRMAFPLPRFATGGPVTTTNDHRQSITVNQHNHGDAARLRADPRYLRWLLRKY